MKTSINLKACVLISMFVLVMASAATGRIIHVDANSPATTYDGSTWPDAFPYLQDALAHALPGDEIHMAQGVYTPDKDGAHPDGTGERYATFQLKNNVIIKGGYAGYGKPDPNARDIDLYKTFLSGDLDENDVGGIDDPSRLDNSFHVLTGTETNQTAILDGCTIIAGNAVMDAEIPYGAGLIALYGSPTLTNCTFTGNSAYAGGAVCYVEECSPTLTNCTFTGNSAQLGGAFVSAGCTFTITNCTFSGNSGEIGGALFSTQNTFSLNNCTFIGNSGIWGGAFYNELSTATITNCIFTENTSNYAGAAIHEAISSSSLYNCLFTANSCTLFGGAMYYWYQSTPRIINCTFAGNSAPNGNAIACDNPEGYEPPPPPSIVRATNCIFWDGGNEIFNNNESTIQITYSDVQQGWTGLGNIKADPRFVNPGYFDSNDTWIDGDYHLLAGSPCIDAGNKSAVPPSVTTDLDGNTRIRGPAVDMGVYESPTIIFVDANAAGANNGVTWSNAYKYLQDALAAVASGDEI